MNSNLFLIVHNSAADVHERGAKVHHDVHDKKELDDHVKNNEVPYPVVPPKSDVIWHHDRHVSGQDEYQPVPQSLAVAVVQKEELRLLVRFSLVLWKPFRSERK